MILCVTHEYDLLSNIPTFGRWSAWGPCSADCDGCSENQFCRQPVCKRREWQARGTCRACAVQSKSKDIYTWARRKNCSRRSQQPRHRNFAFQIVMAKGLIIHCREYMRIRLCALFARGAYAAESQKPSHYCTCSVGSPCCLKIDYRLYRHLISTETVLIQVRPVTPFSFGMPSW